jgi:hypothetical protein
MRSLQTTVWAVSSEFSVTMSIWGIGPSFVAVSRSSFPYPHFRMVNIE